MSTIALPTAEPPRELAQAAPKKMPRPSFTKVLSIAVPSAFFAVFFLGPLIYLNSQELYTLALGLQVFLSEHSNQWGLLMAASTMSVGGSTDAMKTTAMTLSSSSGETTQHTEGAVRASGDASTSVKTAAVAADELATSIAEIGRQLELTNGVVQLAVTEAKATDGEIEALAAAAQKIGDVVKLIRDIAGQTNLLALNATIEAARAGEVGRGFAVVASEVKTLAVQTANATEEIAGQIEAVQSSTTSAVEAIRRIAERMHQINSYTSSVAASVEQQSAATGQISTNVSNAARGSGVVVDVLGKVSNAATHTRTCAHSMLDGSQAVEKAVAELRGEVEQFLAKVVA